MAVFVDIAGQKFLARSGFTLDQYIGIGSDNPCPASL